MCSAIPLLKSDVTFHVHNWATTITRKGQRASHPCMLTLKGLYKHHLFASALYHWPGLSFDYLGWKEDGEKLFLECAAVNKN